MALWEVACIAYKWKTLILRGFAGDLGKFVTFCDMK
jgi:hypothetical protein